MKRVELFGAMRMVTRIDRDTIPLLFPGADNEAGGLVNEYPRVRESWTGTHLGDLFLGGKVNLLSQGRLNPMALALRGTLKLPTADADAGSGTGEYDGFVDVIGSRAFNALEVTGFGGWAMRGDPADLSLSDSARWGAGIGFPTRRSVRASIERYGERYFDEAVRAATGTVVGTDGSISPSSSLLQNEINTSLGLTWQHSSGVLLGAALTYRFGMDVQDAAGRTTSTSGEGFGMQFRIGFHPGVRVDVPPPPAVAAAPPPAPAPPAPDPPPPPTPVANRAPSVRAIRDPCSVEAGKSSTLRAQTSDPDNDVLSVRWSTTGGTLADTRTAVTTWHAETAPGLITFTVTVDDGRGHTASDTITLDVTSTEAIAFEDVFFDFDSSRLRREALPVLDAVIATLKQQPATRLEIEGHTCDIGTISYNLALGKRRAAAVHDYLVKNGIESSRLPTVSYGQERPAHDNGQPNARRLNRRSVLVVRVTDEDRQ